MKKKIKDLLQKNEIEDTFYTHFYNKYILNNNNNNNNNLENMNSTQKHIQSINANKKYLQGGNGRSIAERTIDKLNVEIENH